MADPTLHALEGVFTPVLETDKLIGVAGMAEKVENLQLTPEDTMRTISGPGLLTNETALKIYGVAHARIGTRDVLIRQTVDRLQKFEGWHSLAANQWVDITNPVVTAGVLGVDLTTDDTPDIPFMTVVTPQGIIIFPKGRSVRPLFFDGEIIGNLGYTERPGAPTVAATHLLSTTELGDLPLGGAPKVDIGNKVGVVENIIGSTTNGSRRKRTEYQVIQQWVNRWGDLSPPSGRSDTLVLEGAVIHAGNAMEAGLCRLRYTNLTPGPNYTIARILGRTRSLTTSGTTVLWELPQHNQPSARNIATIPDNTGEIYMDNVSEGRLGLPIQDVAPVPAARMGAMAMGRMWLDAPDGGVWYSLPGKWGTYGAKNVLYPDPNGAGITAMHPVAGGLLVCTLDSTFMITPNDAGTGFRHAVVHPQLGCIAPATIKTLPNGLTLWLGKRGFVGFMEGKAVPIRADHTRVIKQINKGRMLMSVAEVIEGVYHCWVPHGATQIPNLCLTFDGRGWNRRTDTKCRSVTVTRDYRGYAFVAGKDVVSGTNGLLLLDRDTAVLGARDQTAILETSWFLSESGVDQKAVRRLVIWARETALQDMTIEIMRDWREDVVDTVTVPLHAAEDIPGTWDDQVLGSTAVWRRRRPYYGVVDLDIPGMSALKLRITSTKDIDFIGFELQTGVGPKAGSWA